MLFLILVILISYAPLIWKSIKSIFASVYLVYYKKYVGREAILLYHDGGGLFMSGMIATDTYNKIRTILDSLGGKAVDLILHTPGGEIFATMLLSKLLKSYPDLRVVVPRYAMSGGTLLALSCNRLVMGNHAVLGPIDPQIGGIFSGSFNARVWKRISKVKKDKIKDENVGLGIVADQYDKSITKYIHGLLKGRVAGNKLSEFVEMLVSGEVEHSYQFDAAFLSKYLSVESLDAKASRYLYKVLDAGPGSEVLTTATIR